MPVSGMSATQVNVPTSPLEQPEFQITVDERGVWRVTDHFECAAGNLASYIPDPYTAHPTFTFCLLAEAVVTRLEGEIAHIARTWTGLRVVESPRIVEIIGGTSEDPIETHNRYKDITAEDFAKIKVYCEAPTNDDFSLKPKPSGLTTLGQELIDKKLKGIESYLNRGFTVRENWVARTVVTNFGDIGKTVSPPAEAPSISGTWLLIDVSLKRIGGYYEVSRDFRASGPQGWDADIYG